MNKFSNLNEALAWRYATTNFDTTKKISDADMNAILTSANLAPTSFGLQPFKFVVVDNQEVRNSLVADSWGQEHVAKNSRFVVLAIDTNVDDAYINEYIERIMSLRGLASDQVEGYREMMRGSMESKGPDGRAAWARNQAYIALGMMTAEASLMGIDNHAFEGFSPARYDEILGLTEMNLHAVTAIAFGYRTENDEMQNFKKVRKSLEAMTITI